MNFLLVAIGSVGDVNPYLGIGLELRRRGHTVAIVANPYFEPLVRSVDLPFVPLGTVDEWDKYFQSPAMWSIWKFWKISLDYCALRTMRPLYWIVAEHYVPGQTVVAAPGWAFGARLAQEKLGVPLATLHLEPYLLRSVYQSALMPPPLVMNDWVPCVSKRAQLWIGDHAVVDPFVAPATNAFRAELGLPRVRRLMHRWCHSPDRVIGLFPDWFCAPQPDWPTQTMLTGFPMWDQSAVRDVPDDVLQFLDEGPPPLVFTPGTANQHATRFFAAGVEACRMLVRRAIMLTKYPDQLPTDLPAGVRRFEYVPFSYLLSRSAALVHHAGTGTTSQCLAAGIPQVVMPMSFSQPDIARRLTRLGVSETLGWPRFKGPPLARALDRLLSSSAVARRCRDLAGRFDEMRTFERTCDALEALCPARGQARLERAETRRDSSSPLGV